MFTFYEILIVVIGLVVGFLILWRLDDAEEDKNKGSADEDYAQEESKDPILHEGKVDGLDIKRSQVINTALYLTTNIPTTTTRITYLVKVNERWVEVRESVFKELKIGDSVVYQKDENGRLFDLVRFNGEREELQSE